MRNDERPASPAGQLSSDELEQYRRDGFLQVNRPLFAQDKFARLEALFEELLARYGPDDLDLIHFREPRLFEWLLADEVLDLIEPITGPNIGLWSSHFICKPPRIGAETPWHEDSAYWDDRVSTMDGIVTVWLAMDAADRENGAMGVVPGTHRSEVSFAYERVAAVAGVLDRRIAPGQIEEADVVYADLAPGEFTLHDACIVHGADANRSDRRRAGYTMRYFPTTTRIVPETNSGHWVWLARGCDRAGNSYAGQPC